MAAPYAKLPAWADYGLLPLINLVVAFLIAGVVVVFVGENPLRAAYILVTGAFGSGYNIGFTLFYATNFIFTGLAVAVAIHCGLFNIGAEGQAYIGGLGVAIACLWLDAFAPWFVVLPVALVLGATFGALWALIPAWLQAKRGSHIVITTIMFNFIAAATMTWLLGSLLKPAGSMDPASRPFLEGAFLPKLGWLLGLFGMNISSAPLNLSFLIAIVACVAVWLLIWRTRFGYEVRTMGLNPTAAAYAGIPQARIIVLAMLISGALAGLMAINNVMGQSERLLQNSAEGAGFIGIAVALMGRNHPVGIFFAAILFGMLYQGGAELAFEMPKISREMIVVIQGLVILFAGALENMFRPTLSRMFSAAARRSASPEATGAA